jgi:hypothetical protein
MKNRLKIIISKFNVIFVDITFFSFYNLNQNHSDVIISGAGHKDVYRLSAAGPQIVLDQDDLRPFSA